jgi:Tol biopolymer transport system component
VRRRCCCARPGTPTPGAATWLAYGAPRLGHYDLFAVAVDEPDRPPVLLVTGDPQSDEPRFSPDGRWGAYHATAAGGVYQVSVIPFPPTGERWQISGDGGMQPRWAPGGDKLFYLDRSGRLVSVALPGSDPRRAGTPRPLYQFAVGPRDRFLFRVPFGSDRGVPVHGILGWDTDPTQTR